jgi:predicted nucleic acid-binding protein
VFPAIFRVFLDANVLYPASVRDTLLRAFEAGLIQAYWSEQILEEMRRNLVLNSQCTNEQAASLVATLRRVFPTSIVTGYENLLPAMRNDPGDRHVVAAALAARAEVIVTNNLKHFRKEDLPTGMEAQSADTFLQNLFDLEPRVMMEVLRKQAADKRKPPVTFEQHLEGLSRSVPHFVDDVRTHILKTWKASDVEG